jgi:hypothetical protein
VTATQTPARRAFVEAEFEFSGEMVRLRIDNSLAYHRKLALDLFDANSVAWFEFVLHLTSRCYALHRGRQPPEYAEARRLMLTEAPHEECQRMIANVKDLLLSARAWRAW